SSGLGLLTGQSLPAHRVAPAASRDRNGYCHPERRSPRKGMVSSSIWGPCAAHSGWMLAVADRRGEAGVVWGGGTRGGGAGGSGARAALFARRAVATASRALRTARSPSA